MRETALYLIYYSYTFFLFLTSFHLISNIIIYQRNMSGKICVNMYIIKMLQKHIEIFLKNKKNLYL